MIDLSEINPEVALEFCNLLPEIRFRVLICGGDGTIGWVLNAIETLKLLVRYLYFPSVLSFDV